MSFEGLKFSRGVARGCASDSVSLYERIGSYIYQCIYRVSRYPRENLWGFLGCVRGRESEKETNTHVRYLCCLDPRAAGPDHDRPSGVAATVLISVLSQVNGHIYSVDM